MKTRIVMWLITIIMLSHASNIVAQVTIGKSEEAEKYSLLQIKDKAIDRTNGPLDDVTAEKGGLLLPRVKLVDKNELLPFVTQAEVDNPTQDYLDAKKLHTGMIVYNLEENDEKELCLGLNQWDGAQWNCFQNKIGNAIANITDCSTVGFYGIYKDKEALNASNYMTVKLNVTKAGAYTITARAGYSSDHTQDNGYYFTTTGVFMTTGEYEMTIPGAGTPLLYTPDSEPGDLMTLTLNGKPLVNGSNQSCPKYIIVENSAIKPAYKLDCRTVKVVGFGVLDQEVMPSTAASGQKAYIQVTLDVESTADGATYEIKTNEVAGMSFYGKGKLSSASRQTITLEPVEGSIPNATGEQYFTISTNSTTSSSTCNATVMVGYTKKKLLTLSDHWNGYGFGPGKPTTTPSNQDGGSYKVLAEPSNFGLLASSVVKVETIDVAQRGSATGSASTTLGNAFPTATQLQDIIDSENIDIIHFSVRYNPDQASCTVLKKFLDNGGVVIAMMDNAAGDSGSYAQTLLRTVFNNTSITVSSANAAGALYKFRDVDDEITNGPFLDLRGKFWGEDSSASLAASNVPEDEIIEFTTAEDYSQANTPSGVFQGGLTMFRHKTLNFIWIGDGGFLASENATSDHRVPFKINVSTKKPVGTSGYGRGTAARKVTVYNSHTWANILAWAVKAAQR